MEENITKHMTQGSDPLKRWDRPSHRSIVSPGLSPSPLLDFERDVDGDKSIILTILGVTTGVALGTTWHTVGA